MRNCAVVIGNEGGCKRRSARRPRRHRRNASKAPTASSAGDGRFLKSPASASPSTIEQRDQADADVEAVEAGEREKRRGEQIRARRCTPLLNRAPVFESLADDEDAAEQDRRREPARSSRRCLPRCSADSERQIVKLLANRHRLKMPVLSRFRSCGAGSGLRRGVVIEKREDQHAEEAGLRKDEGEDAGLVLLRRRRPPICRAGRRPGRAGRGSRRPRAGGGCGSAAARRNFRAAAAKWSPIPASRRSTDCRRRVCPAGG